MGVVIVGFAVVGGIRAFNEKARQSVVDNLIDRNLTIASNAVSWKAKEDPYAGGNASYTNFSLGAAALSDETILGDFVVAEADGESLVITAVSSRYPDVGIRTYVNGYDVDSTVVAHDGSISLP